MTDFTDRTSIETRRRSLAIALAHNPESRHADAWRAELDDCNVALARFDEMRRNSPWANTFEEAA